MYFRKQNINIEVKKKNRAFSIVLTVYNPKGGWVANRNTGTKRKNEKRNFSLANREHDLKRKKRVNSERIMHKILPQVCILSKAGGAILT